MEELNTYEIIDLFIQKKIGLLDIYNHIQKSTDNYKPHKLRKLVIDIRSRLYLAQQEKNGNLERHEIMRVIDSLGNITFDAQPGELPKPIFECSQDIEGTWKIDTVWKNDDFEKLAYPQEFSHVHELINEINVLISKNDRVKNSAISEIDEAFENLFRPKNNAQKVEDIFAKYGYAESGHWTGHTGDKSELLCAYYALIPILNPGKPTTQGKIFYNKFLLPEDYMCDRMLTNPPANSNKSLIEFERLFAHLMPK